MRGTRAEGLEPPTLGFEGRCSIQLSYARWVEARQCSKGTQKLVSPSMVLVSLCIVGGLFVLALAFVAWQPMRCVRWWLVLRCRQAGLIRGFIDTGDTRWPVFRSGTFEGRTVVVILHGFGVDSFSMLGMAATLSKAGHSVLLPDLPGFGDHHFHPPDALDADRMLDALDALATATAAQRVIVIGSSMGGALAAAWAHRDPNRVAGAVLLNPAGVEPPVVNEVYSADPDEDHPLEIRTMADFNRVMELNFVHIPRIPWLIKRDIVRMARQHVDQYNTIIRTLEPLLRNGLQEILPAISQPVLLVWGDQDGIIDPSVVPLWAAGLPTVEVLMLQHCGHVPWVDCPGETRAAIGQFVDLHTAST